MSELFGLIGEKLTHSLSPKIHGELFNILNMNAKYELFEIKRDELKNGFLKLKAEGVKGLNVTIPYKVDIMEFLDDISIEAKEIGAVNTICFKGDKIIGYNTDYFGFGRMLQKNNIQANASKVAVLGAGGAAKAVIQYFLFNNAKEIVLISRDKKKAEVTFPNIKVISYEEFNEYDKGDIIVNCTPLGMYPKLDAFPVDRKCIAKFSAAVDLIYNPLETLFLKFAKEEGLKSVNGLYMLVGQAMAAEEIWNDIDIGEEITDEIFTKLQ